MWQAEALRGRGSIEDEALNADVSSFRQFLERAAILAVHVEHDERRSARMVLVGLFE